MSEHTYFKFSNAVIVAPLAAAILIWAVFWVELRFQINLNDFGLFPRKLSGLRGILLSPFIHGSLEHLYNNPNIHTEYGDLLDVSSLERMMGSIKPDEIYNIGAQSHVRISFDMPVLKSSNIPNKQNLDIFH